MFKKRFNLKKAIVIAICLVSSLKMSAQDIIILKNGDDIPSIVEEVGIDEIKYKKFENPSGVTYTLKKSEIFMIKYEDGSKDLFNGANSDRYVNTTAISTQPELFYMNGVWQDRMKLRPNQVREIMSENGEALEKYNNGRALYVMGQVLAYPGAFLFGWGLGSLIVGDVDVVSLGIGTASMVSGLIMVFSGENKMKTSVQLYNLKANNRVSYQVNFGFTKMGIGVCMQF